MSKIHLIGAGLMAAALVAGCAKEEKLIVKVGGDKLSETQLQNDVDTVMKMQGDRVPKEEVAKIRRQVSRSIARQFMFEKPLVAKAKTLGLAVTDEDIKKYGDNFLKRLEGRPDAPKSFDEILEKHPFGKERALDEIKAGILIDKLIKTEVYDKNTKNYSEEAKKEIEEIKFENAKKTVSSADALKRLASYKAEIDKAADKKVKFAELAKAHSDCPSKKDGGDLREFARGMMVPEFEKVAFAQKIGEISAPVKTQFGYHLIMTTGKTPAVEAKDDKPATPEKVRASHILVRVVEPTPIPTEEEVIEKLKQRDGRPLIQKYLMDTIKEAGLWTDEEYKDIIPPELSEPEEGENKTEAAPAAAPVAEEKNAEKPAEKSAVETETKK